MYYAQGQRVNRRQKSQEFTVDIINGMYVFFGKVVDVSFYGLKVTRLPNQVFVQKCKFISVVSGQNYNYKFEIEPCWIQLIQPGNYLDVGFRIINPPESWIALIHSMLPEPQKVESCRQLFSIKEE